MYYPFRIIESKISSRDQFELLEGYQPTYALFYLKKGSFTIEIDGKREDLTVGDCLILSDDIRFRRSVLDPIEFVYVKFARTSDCPYQLDVPYGRAHFRDEARFASSMEALERSLVSDEPSVVSFRQHLLIDILFQMHFERHGVGEPTEAQYHDRIVREAIAYIVGHIGQRISIDDVCRAVRTNPSTLNYRLRREVGASCGRLIMNERMKKARHLLLSTTYQISEIATRCGFENLYYFSNAFKKENGVSPTEFLRWHRKIGSFAVDSP